MPATFFFLLAYAVFSEVKNDLQGAKNLKKSIKTEARVANGREEFEQNRQKSANALQNGVDMTPYSKSMNF